MTTLETKITELNQKIKNTSCKYKLKSLKSKLGFLKAELKGNFVTIEDLKEFKKLILWKLWNTDLPYNVRMNKSFEKPVLTAILDSVNEGLVFKTTKSIKNMLLNLAQSKVNGYVHEFMYKNNSMSDMNRLNATMNLPSSMR